jgi:GntR family transcriptional regulator/MocR family aminotransferase
MRPFDFALPLPPDASGPMYLHIAEALRRRIQSGAVLPGALLPGTRQLSEQLGVNRKTVALAYAELEAEGWIESQVGRGTTVAQHLPSGALSHANTSTFLTERSTQLDLATDLSPLTEGREGLLDLREGYPDPRLIPATELSQAYHRGLSKHDAELLHEGELRGNLALREALFAWLSERRGILASPQSILITRGVRSGLALLVRALGSSQPSIGVEAPTPPELLEALSAVGARVIPLPVDEGGLRVDALEKTLADTPLSLLLMRPHGHFATGAPLAPERRARLLELSSQHRMTLVEDDTDYEFHDGARPPLPMASADKQHRVMTVGSFSRLMAPGIRVGFLVAKPSVIDRLAKLKQGIDAQGDRVLESALAELMRSETLHRFVRKARRAYQERRNAVVQHLASWKGVDVSSTSHGLGLWMTLPPAFKGEAFLRAAYDKGLRLGPLDTSSDQMRLRLGFGALQPEEMAQVLVTLKSLYEKHRA